VEDAIYKSDIPKSLQLRVSLDNENIKHIF